MCAVAVKCCGLRVKVDIAFVINERKNRFPSSGLRVQSDGRSIVRRRRKKMERPDQRS